MASAELRILRAAPAVTIQDAGRAGQLRFGVGASGPMDRLGFERAGRWLGAAGSAGLEFGPAGLSFVLDSKRAQAAFDGGAFTLTVNGRRQKWPAVIKLTPGDVVDITPGAWGNYGYVRFDREMDVPMVLGSRSTSLVAGLGGLQGRALVAGDILGLAQIDALGQRQKPTERVRPEPAPIRVLWGLHADLFEAGVRQAFVEKPFAVSQRLDRMGVRLNDAEGVFAGEPVLSLVSDAVVAGDIQILGDGTPIVLMRDHQPTGGYPRIATVISADLDRFAQMRPGETVRFAPVTPQAAHALAASAA